LRSILVVDDEDALRQWLRRVLESAGYRVIEAPNGAVGLAAFRDNAVALVITDILMPAKDGIETLIELRRLSPTTPVIAMSGGGRSRTLDFLKFAKKLGPQRILEKPFSRELLLASVEACLAGRGPA
jgi:DNA-binding response OmpR family regulator